VKVLSVIGMLGAGKSTAILAALEEIARRGGRAGAVINDSGEVQPETDTIMERFPIRSIGGG